jgi:hypothetical protein
MASYICVPQVLQYFQPGVVSPGHPEDEADPVSVPE